MFRSLIASIATVFAAFAITGASFADSTTKPPSAAISPSWTGFYAGSNIGYGWTEDQSTAISSNDPATQVLILNAVPLSLNSPTLKSSGVLGGLQLGYNYQFAPNWLLGIETDLQVSDLKDRSSGAFTELGVPFSSTAHQHVDWFGTVRGRLGFLITPDWLVYGTGGFAYGRVEQSYSIANNAKFISIGFLTAPSFICVEASVCASGSDTQTRTGWTAGGGVEWRIPNFAILNRPATVKLEYLHVNLGNKDVIVRALSNPAASFTARFEDTAFNVVRTGVNVRF